VGDNKFIHVGKSERKNPFWRPGYKREYNIKMVPRRIFGPKR
jgi:hypothetical protein